MFFGLAFGWGVPDDFERSNDTAYRVAKSLSVGVAINTDTTTMI